ncbi:MAG: nickel pincer cofactor biosynthesis protein LarC [Candidatus Dadabacteria bacterium]|nr:MAG: nickel pincer cofactor biosynthesis protein LarC [Candidatus Dadabacteria bacterium]
MARHLHIDPWNGIAGDMFLAALVDAGADPEEIRRAIASARLAGVRGIEVSFPEVTSHGLRGRALRVRVEPPEQPPHRRAAELRRAIAGADLPPGVRDRALDLLDRLARAEARVHGVDPAEVHFHEIGGADTVVDLVGAAAGLDALGVDSVSCGVLPLGRGQIRSSHGVLPSPAPATLELLKGVPVRGVEAEMETVTPTGAALAAGLAGSFGPAPAFALEAVGTGFGTTLLKDRPNCLRVWLGRRDTAAGDEVVLLETNLDDIPGELLGPVIGALLTAGALDAWITPILMKKGRPAHLVAALCPPEREPAVEEAFWRHTTTLGVRKSRWSRACLERTWTTAQTPWGPVRVKVGRRGTEVFQRAPEYEDCLAIARRHGVPLKLVYEAVWQNMG